MTFNLKNNTFTNRLVFFDETDLILITFDKLKKKEIMKKIVFGLLMLVGFYSNAQEKEFTFTADKGMTDFIVTPIESKTAPEIYKKVIEWIKVTFKNPDKVILSTIENEYVRFEGFSESLYSYNAM